MINNFLKKTISEALKVKLAGARKSGKSGCGCHDMDDMIEEEIRDYLEETRTWTYRPLNEKKEEVKQVKYLCKGGAQQIWGGKNADMVRAYGYLCRLRNDRMFTPTYDFVKSWCNIKPDSKGNLGADAMVTNAEDMKHFIGAMDVFYSGDKSIETMKINIKEVSTSPKITSKIRDLTLKSAFNSLHAAMQRPDMLGRTNWMSILLRKMGSVLRPTGVTGLTMLSDIKFDGTEPPLGGKTRAGFKPDLSALSLDQNKIFKIIGTYLSDANLSDRKKEALAIAWAMSRGMACHKADSHKGPLGVRTGTGFPPLGRRDLRRLRTGKKVGALKPKIDAAAASGRTCKFNEIVGNIKAASNFFTKLKKSTEITRIGNELMFGADAQSLEGEQKDLFIAAMLYYDSDALVAAQHVSDAIRNKVDNKIKISPAKVQCIFFANTFLKAYYSPLSSKF